MDGVIVLLPYSLMEKVYNYLRPTFTLSTLDPVSRSWDPYVYCAFLDPTVKLHNFLLHALGFSEGLELSKHLPTFPIADKTRRMKSLPSSFDLS